jgi:protein-tyrosine-phosphatase
MFQGKNILFVCTGNTCRSVIAHGLFIKIWKQITGDMSNPQVFSAGVGAVDGMRASSEALEILRDEGIDFSRHRSMVLTREMVNRADRIFTMTSAQKNFILANFPEAEGKVWLIHEYAFGSDTGDICDPYGQGIDIYRLAADEIQNALRNIIINLHSLEKNDQTLE